MWGCDQNSNSGFSGPAATCSCQTRLGWPKQAKFEFPAWNRFLGPNKPKFEFLYPNQFQSENYEFCQANWFRPAQTGQIWIPKPKTGLKGKKGPNLNFWSKPVSKCQMWIVPPRLVLTIPKQPNLNFLPETGFKGEKAKFEFLDPKRFQSATTLNMILKGSQLGHKGRTGLFFCYFDGVTFKAKM